MTTLNDAIRAMARRCCPAGFDTSPDAPGTLEALCAHLDAGNRMVVWNGGSGFTIWGDPRVNHAFRAWHDWHHWNGRLPFTPSGEAEACRRQCADLRENFGASWVTDFWCRILDAEVNGQLRYAEAHCGHFPTDQSAFVWAYLRAPDEAIASTF